MKILPAWTFVVLSLFLTAHVNAHSGHTHDEVAEVTVSNAQLRAFLPASPSSVAYFTLHNPSDHATTLSKASIDGLGRVEIHQHRHVDGMMKMEKVDSIIIKPHSTVKFQPGGFHLMVFEPTDELKVGQERKLTLYFKDGNRVFTQAEVVSLQGVIDQDSDTQHEHSHH